MRKDELVGLGAAVARARVEKQWTQAELGRRAGLHPSHVSRIERGVGNPLVATLWSLAEALEVGLGTLVMDAQRSD
jgi:transcriptional regulator with XRE-family HTH domain